MSSSSISNSDPHSESTLKLFPQYERAIESYEDGKNTQALKIFDELLAAEEFPDKNVCWYLKGQIFLEEGNINRAWDCILKAESLGHVDAKNLVQRVRDEENVKELDEEEAQLRKYVREAPQKKNT